MPSPFLGEIKIIAFDFAPQGWAFCNGQLLPINQNQALFSLFGTYYGGNGQTTFALPDLRGRIPVNADEIDFLQGQTGGEQTHTLTSAEMAAHGHRALGAGSGGNQASPANNYWADWGKSTYAGSANSTMAGTVSTIGGNQAHENMSPYIVLNFIVALDGIFPLP
jgi:microcystin-dependent protein